LSLGPHDSVGTRPARDWSKTCAPGTLRAVRRFRAELPRPRGATEVPRKWAPVGDVHNIRAAREIIAPTDTRREG